jgi:Na+/melibiose symporter-like transporter
VLSVLLRTWNVSCLILCYWCYRGFGKLVVLFFVIYVIEDFEGELSYIVLAMLWSTWKVSCPILCTLCYAGLGGSVVVFFPIYVIEDLED